MLNPCKECIALAFGEAEAAVQVQGEGNQATPEKQKQSEAGNTLASSSGSRDFSFQASIETFQTFLENQLERAPCLPDRDFVGE